MGMASDHQGRAADMLSWQSWVRKGEEMGTKEQAPVTPQSPTVRCGAGVGGTEQEGPVSSFHSADI